MLDKLINYAFGIAFFGSFAFIIALALLILSPIKGALVVGAVMLTFLGICAWASDDK